ncbi:hypothetical protein GJ496_003995 [Pomphorhynchus laevis]|nr:hypothetical protein GJ496_003995 [Pomphorhynchus laevis]
MKLDKKYTLYLIHHSHTDIGYTERPEFTIKKQVKYIRDILGYLDQIYSGEKIEWSGFKWTCETFMIVEEFFLSATNEEKEKFIKYVKNGDIGLSGGYVNTAEFVDPSIKENMYNKISAFCKEHKLNITCGMQADVNGFGLGYAKGIIKNGIKNYYACVHTHHGMYPDFKKHSAFKWEMDNGEKLLVFNGEHYMFGNGFGFAPGAVALYGFDDNVDYMKYNLATGDEWMEMSESRFERYLGQLTRDGYDKDYISLCIHGKFTDNSMPNPEIAKRVSDWNKKNSDFVEVKMVTLEEFFDKLQQENDIPTYKGEWPDWWTDGIGSAPRELKIFKNTQSRYLQLKKLANKLDPVKCEAIEKNLVMYSEHTFGSWDSISNPYHAFTHEQWAAKQAFCFNAMKQVDDLELETLEKIGQSNTDFEISDKFKIINTSNIDISQTIRVPFKGGESDSMTGFFNILDENGKIYKYNVVQGLNHPEINVNIPANECLIINVKVVQEDKLNVTKHPYYARYNLGGSDDVQDLHINENLSMNSNNYYITENNITTNYLKIKWNKSGIISWFDINHNCELLDQNRNHNPFIPVYEVTNNTPRNMLGRNRKGMDVSRSIGTLLGSKITEQNINYIVLCQEYEVSGCLKYTMNLKICLHSTKVDISIKLDKQLEPNPENLYISLPFRTSIKDEIWFSKANAIIRPWTDQIPGTLTDFYSVYAGINVCNDKLGVIISTPDTQLIQVGDIKYKDRILYGDKALNNEQQHLYVWAMNNIWETNFVKSLAGFYEFNFVVESNSKFCDQQYGLNYCNALNEGLVVIPIK